MTSASELFCNRRWRPRRCTWPELTLEQHPLEEDLHLQRPFRRQGRCCSRIRRKECGDASGLRPFAGHHLHQSHLLRHLRDHEHSAVGVRDQTPPEWSSGNSSRVGFPTCRVKRWKRAANDHQLPDIVVQARERLLQRLRSMSLGHKRQMNTSEGIEPEGGNSLEVPHHGEQFAPDSSAANSSVGTDDRVQNSSSMEKPEGLIWEVFCSLPPEIFQEHDPQDEETMESSAALLCSICLELYHEGDELTRLTCGHKFHPACLEPWLRSRGDCPYCRTRI